MKTKSAGLSRARRSTALGASISCWKRVRPAVLEAVGAFGRADVLDVLGAYEILVVVGAEVTAWAKRRAAEMKTVIVYIMPH